jgi:prepilin signal peptidase PulO-like enzyme (type II secretory pathway)
MFVISMLLVAMVIDFKMQLIPDTIQIVLLLLGIIVTVADYTNWLGHIIGMVTGGGIYLLIAGFSLLVFKKEGMGMGDVKLMSCLGLIFGLKRMPTGFLDFFAVADSIFTITVLAFFMAAIVAVILIITKKTAHSSYMAFGPYIVIGTILVMLFGTEPFLNTYLSVCTGLSNLITGWMYK